MQLKVLTVSELTAYIKKLVSSDVILNRVMVCGEISNYQVSSNTAFFTLKDLNSSVNCIMFDSTLNKLTFSPIDGVNVIIKAKTSFYEKDGRFYMNVIDIRPNGTGELHIAFQLLKERLYKKGFFDEKHKKPLPLHPHKICVITSPTGSVIHDIISVIRRRKSPVDILIYPVKVQGEQSSKEIADGLQVINQRNDIDVIILARGGGSLEELWAFNEEIVADAIYKSRIPVISAVGHETDYTISDFVADRRAPTPSAAAEIVSPSFLDIKIKQQNLNERLISNINKYIRMKRDRLNTIANSYIFKNPREIINNRKLQLAYLERRLSKSIATVAIQKEGVYKEIFAKFSALNPKSILTRGYAIIQDMDGKVVNASKINSGDDLNIMFSDGNASCTIKEVKLNG